MTKKQQLLLLAISSDGNFVVTGHTDQAILCDAKTGKFLCCLPDQKFNQISISPNGRCIIDLDENGTASIWRLNLTA